MICSETFIIPANVVIDRVYDQHGTPCEFTVDNDDNTLEIHIVQPLTCHPVAAVKTVDFDVQADICLNSVEANVRGLAVDVNMVNVSDTSFDLYLDADIDEEYVHMDYISNVLADENTAQSILDDTDFNDLAMIIAKATDILYENDRLDTKAIANRLVDNASHGALCELRKLLSDVL